GSPGGHRDGNTVEDVVLTGHSSSDSSLGGLVEVVEDGPPDQRPGTDDVDPPRVHERHGRPLLAACADQVFHGLLDSIQVQVGTVDDFGVVVLQLQRVGGDCGDCAGDPDDRLSLMQRYDLSDVFEDGERLKLRHG